MSGINVAGASVARIIREYEEKLRVVSDNTILVPPADGLAIVGKTTDGGFYPTVPLAVYLLTLQGIDAEDTEGAVATFTDEEGVVPAINIGANIPDKGVYVIAHSISGVWAFSY